MNKLKRKITKDEYINSFYRKIVKQYDFDICSNIFILWMVSIQ